MLIYYSTTISNLLISLLLIEYEFSPIDSYIELNVLSPTVGTILEVVTTSKGGA
jgi:hypothetical protein